MSDLVLFKSFYVQEEADSLCQFLQSKGIRCEVRKQRTLLDTVYVGHSGDKTIYLLMEQVDFEKANKLIDEEIRSRIDEIGPDYYLHSFSDDELMEVIRKPDEWNNQDVLIAQDLLAKRDMIVPDAEIVKSREARKITLAKPGNASPWFLLASYIFTLLFPLYGIVVPLFMLYTKTVLSDGTKVPAYSTGTRMHARVILLIGVVLLALFLLRIFSGSRSSWPYPFF